MHLTFKRGLLAVVFIWSAISSLNGQNLDVDILKGINPQHPGSKYWRGTSGSTFWVPGAIVLGQVGYGLAAHDKRSLGHALELLGNVVISTAVSEAIKVTVKRERPADKYPDVIFTLSPTHGKSFPSGHATLAFATATTVSLQYHTWYVTVPAYLWASSVAYSRMYLGKHYPSDVLTGAVIGVGSGYLTHWLNRKLFRQ